MCSLRKGCWLLGQTPRRPEAPVQRGGQRARGFLPSSSSGVWPPVKVPHSQPTLQCAVPGQYGCPPARMANRWTKSLASPRLFLPRERGPRNCGTETGLCLSPRHLSSTVPLGGPGGSPKGKYHLVLSPSPSRPPKGKSEHTPCSTTSSALTRPVSGPPHMPPPPTLTGPCPLSVTHVLRAGPHTILTAPGRWVHHRPHFPDEGQSTQTCPGHTGAGTSRAAS